MSPTVFRYKSYRFFSREEPRIHIHVVSPHGDAKFWLEPIAALASNCGFSGAQLNEIQKLIEEKKNEIKKAWKAHFSN